MTRYALVLAVGCLTAAPAFADGPKLDRSLGKQPAYQTKSPRYGLLVFGPQAQGRVWLVLDGDTLYVDRNGNGDLTDAGEKIAAQKRPGRNAEDDGYSFDVGDVTAGGRTHKGLHVAFRPLRLYEGNRPDVKAALAKDPKALAATVSVDADVPGLKGGGLGGRVGFSAGPWDLTGVLRFADTPAAAPAVWCGGPLQVTCYGERPNLRIDRDNELILVVGTPGFGPGAFAMLGYEGTIPAAAHPVAEITLPPAKPDQPPARAKYELPKRC
jgi:hypothetical protein